MYRYYNLQNDRDELLALDLVIEGDFTAITSSVKLDINSSEFYDFESSILEDCEIRGYQLEDSYESCVAGSLSQYYIYSKVEDGKRLKVLLKIRVADHHTNGRIVDGKRVSEKDLSNNYVKQQAAKIAKERYGQTRGYRPRNINIVFDGVKYDTYEDALREIESKLDEFDK